MTKEQKINALMVLSAIEAMSIQTSNFPDYIGEAISKLIIDLREEILTDCPPRPISSLREHLKSENLEDYKADAIERIAELEKENTELRRANMDLLRKLTINS
jgi:hypothetical protein